MARWYKATIYAAPSRPARALSHVRRGRLVRLAREVEGTGCPKGRWFALPDRGYVCSARGFELVESVAELEESQVADLRRPLFFSYGKVINQGAGQLSRLPSASEAAKLARAAAGQGRFPALVQRRMKGVFFLALDRPEAEEGYRFFRTVRGKYVRAEDLELVRLSQMHGEFIEGELSLPLAFVFASSRPAYREQGDQLERVGLAAKHARFAVEGLLERDGRRYVQGPDGLLLELSAVRLVTERQRPAGVGRGERWIHVDLAEQALVAYEGDQPIFATLVSTGRSGHSTPTGLYRVQNKQVSTTMRGPDPDEGWYEIEEVPWTMFYRRLYAVHGAYWHDDFGQVRSHGCTNLAPADARWLFHWSAPELPAGWHARWSKGTAIYFTR